VRPNSGRIEGDGEIEVQVLLQAMKEDPPLDYKCRDKFLVQSVAITPDLEAIGVPEIWSRVEKEQRKGAVNEWKIKCVFLPPSLANGAATTNGTQLPPTPNTNDESRYDDSSADSPVATRHQRFESIPPEGSPSSGPAPVGPVSVPASRPADAPSSHSHVSAKSSPTTSAFTEASEDDITLRQRATAATQQAAEAVKKSTKEAVKVVKREAADGVPVPVVAALCLLAFLLAYLFF